MEDRNGSEHSSQKGSLLLEKSKGSVTIPSPMASQNPISFVSSMSRPSWQHGVPTPKLRAFLENPITVIDSSGKSTNSRKMKENEGSSMQAFRRPMPARQTPEKPASAS